MLRTIKKKKIMEALSHCFTKFSRSPLHRVQKPQPLQQKTASPVAHLLGDCWTTYLSKQAGF